jgi:hypothetical protein
VTRKFGLREAATFADDFSFSLESHQQFNFARAISRAIIAASRARRKAYFLWTGQ